MEYKIGQTLYFSELWDGNGDGEELLKSGCISPDEEQVIKFEIVIATKDILCDIVKIIDIY